MSHQPYVADLEFLRSHTDIHELTDGRSVRVAIAPAWQGRAMTSTLAGADGQSFGWLNRQFIAAGQPDETFNNFGGEDRFWLGPEAGQFGLWFQPGEPFDLDHWKTPAGFNEGAFQIGQASARSIAMSRAFAVTNAAGRRFDCHVDRTIHLLDAQAIGELLGSALPENVQAVAFESVNELTNAGQASWKPEEGLLSVWILGQFKPLPAGWVVVPFKPGDEALLGPRATTDYFGPLSADRCKVGDDHLLFRCDGQYRSKIGISPQRSLDRIGSWDPDAGVLTVVRFTLGEDAPQRPYVNSLWEVQQDPYAGDVINSYNDGEPEPGAGQLGPFYEIETSSPAALLDPDASITHRHQTCHLTGDRDALRAIARDVLSVDLGEMGCPSQAKPL